MPKELKRHLSWLDAASIVVGVVIGAGIFVTPQGLARQVPSANAMMLASVVSGLLVFCGALAFAELSTMLPAAYMCTFAKLLGLPLRSPAVGCIRSRCFLVRLPLSPPASRLT